MTLATHSRARSCWRFLVTLSTRHTLTPALRHRDRIIAPATDLVLGKRWPDAGRYESSGEHDEHNQHDGWGLHLLLAGDAHDAPELRRLIAMLPRHAYGQVYVEVGATGGQRHVDPARWELPQGMSLTVLRRSPGSPRPRRGRLLAAALAAWADEWLPDGGCRCAGPFALWVGCAASPDVERLCRSLNDRLDLAPAHLHRPDL